ncbi:MAG: type II toxin-antitoxin system HicA family toxin [Ignavibacteria bacterium]|jgi:predicted RNA binding protein YcfA (HicA-like mRNA interferase family)|nr:type II toxin-antitoxin system HicA family toxin [Ignavibacteria bacterium]
MKSISAKYFCKILERNGWNLDRVQSSHFIYEKTGYCSVSVPVHGNKDLPIGTLKALMRAAGLTEADLD